MEQGTRAQLVERQREGTRVFAEASKGSPMVSSTLVRGRRSGRLGVVHHMADSEMTSAIRLRWLTPRTRRRSRAMTRRSSPAPLLRGTARSRRHWRRFPLPGGRRATSSTGSPRSSGREVGRTPRAVPIEWTPGSRPTRTTPMTTPIRSAGLGSPLTSVDGTQGQVMARRDRSSAERRPRDSNPRGGCPPTRSPGVPLRPLGQASASSVTRPGWNGRPYRGGRPYAEATGFEPVRGGLGP